MCLDSLSDLYLSAHLILHAKRLKGLLFIYRSKKPLFDPLATRLHAEERFRDSPVKLLQITNKMSTGTFRSTPTNRGQGRGQLPNFESSPSNIPVPRPKLETHGNSTIGSEAGTSTLSASRAKQSKRDEVARALYSVGSLADKPSRPSERKWRRT